VRRPRGEARSRRAGASRELAPILESTSSSPTRAPRIRQDPDEARPHLPGQTPRNPATQPRPDSIGTPSHCPVRCTQVRPTACVKGTRAALASGHDPFQFSHALGCSFWMEMLRSRRRAVTESVGRASTAPGECWQTVFVDDLAIHSVHLNPYSAARRVAQLQILAERLPTGYNVVLGDFNLAPRLGVGQTVAARQTVAGRAAWGGRLHRSAWHARRRGLPVPARAAWSEPEGWRSVFAPPTVGRRCTRNRDAQTAVDPSCGLVTHQA
jgi:hypothetical protein